jgi:two-component system KDP operon response regulator KdpE
MAATKILIIEDDPGVVRALSLKLKRAGYEPLTALDGVQATMFARTKSPALILLDLGLPGGDGLRVLENLSRSSSTASIPVLVLTGRNDPEKFKRARELGAVDCFLKGANPEPLLAKIRALTTAPADESDASAPASDAAGDNSPP